MIILPIIKYNDVGDLSLKKKTLDRKIVLLSWLFCQKISQNKDKLVVKYQIRLC